MLSRKLFNIVLSMLVISSLLFGGSSQALAQVQETQTLPALQAGPISTTDETKVPHYFGPYPNWANSPQVLADATVEIGLGTPTPVYYGNLPLSARAYATDFATVPGTLGPVFVVIPTALPNGMLNSFQIWNQADPGQSPTPSAGGWFYAYVLRPDPGIPTQYQVVYADSVVREVPPLTDPLVGVEETFPVAPGVAVQANDVIAFYGEGIPVDVGGGTDILSYPATANPDLVTPEAPLQGSIITLGDPGFPLFSQDRTYSFAALVTPTVVDPGTGAQATASVDPKTGAISAITITSPGDGYLVAPKVTITSGVTPTTAASAQAFISPGVINSIAVNEAGFGFIAPAVTITGGGTPTAVATAQASGGVDDLQLLSGGSGYALMPIVEFSLPNLPLCSATVTTNCGTQATAVATMTNGIVDGVTVVDPGSGYFTRPTVTIFDGDGKLTVLDPAIATATIGIGQIDVISGGAGYDSSTPINVTILDISDPQNPVDRFASATANVAVKGAVTRIDLVAPGFGGAGYLTPGLKKFVDPLPGLCNPATGTGCSAAKYIPLGVPDTTTYPGSDYYEIGLVQYRMEFHSDLPPTIMRGYVQLSTSVVPGNEVPLTNAKFNGNPNGSEDAPIAGYKGVTAPHYLGPTIVAAKNRPVRILFRNLLPIGSDGNLFLPVDATLMGAGMGPDMVGLDKNGDGQPDVINPGETGVPIMEMGTDSVLDEVRNPACGQLPKPAECFAENRATLHLHGGITPWISDGTPHQWITPAGEGTNYPEGVSVHNVPDMNGCEADNDGCMTFFYTNQQSARLMFYHDHAWGITRLNVYAGEAAGYVITDETEQKLFVDNDPDPNINTAPFKELGIGTPLIIQDKTFVSDNIAKQDPTWDKARWGDTGSLWVPHVYMPAQNPGDPSGMSGFGRWMYGPWFWPPANNVRYAPIANPYYNMDPLANPPFSQPLTDSGLHDGLGNLKPCNLDDNTTWQYQSDPFCEPPLMPGTANISVGMEAFNDTPLVNGTVYPKTTVDPKAYRYRILNAANDRFWNLSWYVADPRTGTLSEVALNPVELAAAQLDPVVFPTPDEAWSPKGPNWIQIGTEGGFLPAPVVIPAQPTTWITDPTRFDVGNVDQHSLLLAPAERADVIVDFSQFRGKTLILYNDAPAAFPARVPSYDYYTGAPDLSPVGVPSTLPGYGPNTRTIMQVTVSTAAPGTPYDRPNTSADKLGQLQTAFGHQPDKSGVFESGQNPIIVGQAAYNGAYGTNFASGAWCNSPNNPTAQCDGFLRIMEQGGMSFKFNALGGNPGDWLGGPQLSIPIEPKAIHDEMNSAHFDEFGRMTANLGLEAPGATPLLQNIVLYPYVNPATEILDATNMPSSLDVTPIASGTDGTQIWKITHNGVDTHPIHFHLYDVQLLNRVSWDNIVQPPEANELGWKDTVRISPLQDTIVAVRPIVPTLPFGLPDSVRLLNPMMPRGARGAVNDINGTEAGFNNVSPDGQAWVGGPIVNELTNFGWEYVFHCHILSHEEMDMMRPVVVHVGRALPDEPVLTFTRGSVILNWTDGTPFGYNDPLVTGNYADPTTWANLKNEVGFRIERAEVAGGLAGTYTEIAKVPANTTTYTDVPPDPTVTYDYRVTAWNAAGDSPQSIPPQNVVRVQGMVATTTVVAGSPNPSVIGQSVTFTATVSPAAATGTVTFNIDGVDVATQTLAGVPVTYSTAVLALGSHPVIATYSGDANNSPSTGTLTQIVNKLATTTSVASSLNPSTAGQNVTFTASVSPAAATGTVTFSIDGTAGAPVALSAGQATFSTSTLTVGAHPVIATYSGDGTYASSTSATLSQTVNAPPVVGPAAPTITLVELLSGPTRIRLTWIDNSNNENNFQVWRSVDGSPFTLFATTPNRSNAQRTAIGGTVTFTNNNNSLTPGSTYAYYVIAVNTVPNPDLPSAPSNTSASVTVPAPPAAPTLLGATAVSPTQINLAWTYTTNTETGFTIQRTTNPNSFAGATTITLNGANQTSYNNTGRQPNTTYYYRVRAFNAAGPSAWSNTASATTLPAIGAVPAGLTVTPAAGSLIISWSYTSNGAPGPIMFDVQRSNTGAGGWTTVANNITPTTFTNTGLPANTTRYYRVRSVTAAGNSAWTTVVPGTTLP